MLRRFAYVTFVWVLLSLTVVSTLAQSSCPAIVEQALSALGDNCANLDRNNACYGFDQVAATFASQQPPGFFSTQADRAPLREMSSISTSPLSIDRELYGAAVLNVQANVPNTLPGQGVVFLLLGEAELSNATPPEAAVEMIDPVEVLVSEESALYSAPSFMSNAPRTIAPGDILLVDGANTEAQWLRVVDETSILWVSILALDPQSIPPDLPIVGSNVRAPMQAFYFSTGIGQPTCNEAESVIAVQSPERIQVDLTVNGVDIRLGSMITLNNVDETTTRLVVHRGNVQLSNGQNLPAGQTIFASTDDEGNVQNWEGQRDSTEEERELGEKVQENLNDVSEANGWPTQTLPDPNEETDESSDEEGSEQIFDEAGNLIHIVASGETLFGIARLYDASMPEIVRVNNLTDPRLIFRGQRLIIPNPGSGFVGLDNQTAGQPGSPPTGDQTGEQPERPPASDSEVGSVDCSNFSLISPVSTVPVGNTNYSWTAAPGATVYEIVFYDFEGRFAQSFRTEQTSIGLNTGQIPTGSQLSWEVRAYRDGAYACVTARTGLLERLPDPNPPLPPGPFQVQHNCTDSSAADVSWTNADPALPVVIVAEFGVSEPLVKTYQFFGATGRATIQDTSGLPLDFTTVSNGNIAFEFGSCG